MPLLPNSEIEALCMVSPLKLQPGQAGFGAFGNLYKSQFNSMLEGDIPEEEDSKFLLNVLIY